MLEQWYGPERARRIRAERSRSYAGDVRGFAEGPPTTPTPLTGAQRTFLAGRMDIIMTALRSAHGIALQTAENWPTMSSFDWRRMVPVLGLVVAAAATPDEVKRNVVSTLRSSMKAQVEMRAASVQDVLDGRITFDQWLRGVRATSEGLISVLKTLGDYNAASSLIEYVNNVVDDVKRATIWVGTKSREVLENLPESSQKYGPFLIGGAVLLGGFILYQYATAPLRFLPPKTKE
jgi:hypothetical protein